MERIGVRELRQHASRYLRLVQDGETVEVTQRGKPVARLVPPNPATTARERLVAAGRLRPAARAFVLPVRMPAREGEPDSATVLSELREERV